jgi:hypothetical protein
MVRRVAETNVRAIQRSMLLNCSPVVFIEIPKRAVADRLVNAEARVGDLGADKIGCRELG